MASPITSQDEQPPHALDLLDADQSLTLEDIARRLHARPDLQSTLIAVLKTAIDACDGVVAAGVNLYARGHFEPQAVLGQAPPKLDAEQQRTGTGPCIDSSREQRTLLVEDMAVEPRWPGFGPMAISLGIHAMACVPLWVDESQLGSLSLYSERPRTFDDRFLRVAGLVAAHAALAIATARRADNLVVAVDGRDVIGQAKGILMERHRITADAAFDLLRRASNDTQLKVQAVAERLVTTGELPTSQR